MENSAKEIKKQLSQIAKNCDKQLKIVVGYIKLDLEAKITMTQAMTDVFSTVNPEEKDKKMKEITVGEKIKSEQFLKKINKILKEKI